MWCFLSFKLSSRSTTEFFKCFLLYLTDSLLTVRKTRKTKNRQTRIVVMIACHGDAVNQMERPPFPSRMWHAFIIFFPPRLTILNCFPKNSHCFKLGLHFLKGSKWSKQPNVYCNVWIEYEVERHFVQLIKYHVNAFICILTGVYSVIVFDTQNNIEKKNLKAMTLNTFKCINTWYILKYRRA